MTENVSAARRASELRAEAEAARARSERLLAEAGAWDAGAEGELRVATALADLPDALMPRVLHDRLLRPGRSAVNLDHLVVTTGGLMLVDAKNWAGQVSVYEGSLWQHTFGEGGSRNSNRKTAEAQKVGRMAEEVAQVLGVPVTPVLCLAGDRAAGFGPPQMVAGVAVVPVGDLAEWVARLPPVLAPDQVQGLANRMAVTFPPAAVAPARTIELPIPRKGNRARALPSAPRTQVRAAGPGRRGGDAAGPGRPGKTTRGSARSRRKSSLLSALGCLIMLAIVWLGAVAMIDQTASRPSGQNTGNTSTTAGSCLGVNAAQVTKLVGAPVYLVQASKRTCLWSVTPGTHSGQVAISTGYLVVATSHEPVTRTDAYGNRHLLVPQGANVPGSKPVATAAQNVEVVIDIQTAHGGHRISTAAADKTARAYAAIVLTNLKP
ncbi:nuclease-related domain-containing protein [Angustibacter luteus]|uniref:Nuclease-related domain-containing protein n=1 Tax=Angustibacter luteus TaxID=658456 RepID=A0ABW1JC99_9ACTN